MKQARFNMAPQLGAALTLCLGFWSAAQAACTYLFVAGLGLSVGQPGQSNAYGFRSGVAECGDTITIRN